ncbi:hypothetical protein FRACYDRAFT_249115 [Fragilariopsis cylindrus CCMP1102]|uniref:Uncharacterized protein n=1 Tax=Fragilariopsis cylindrus CCMP1102 TaxID=635003 RepID=A0A1E7ET81_9STRA|nr:hypothetical protein FRACYDRAFT_249115 [Fragilariopsis cylindrus CCMP1102]|eukprot:OEU08773.1 hypothetical protein FRACYDRAFT_249115 [Fragilariopsis cylindrus CCMP1102]
MSMSGEEGLAELGWLAYAVVSVCCASLVLSSLAVIESDLLLPLTSLLLVLSEELDDLESWVDFYLFVGGGGEIVVATLLCFLFDFSMALWLTCFYPFCVRMTVDRRHLAFLMLMSGSWWRPSRAQPNTPRQYSPVPIIFDSTMHCNALSTLWLWDLYPRKSLSSACEKKHGRS